MKKGLFLVFLMGITNVLLAQLIRPFPVAGTSGTGNKPADSYIKNYRSYQLDNGAFSAAAGYIPKLSVLGELKHSTALIELPLADGTKQTFFIAAIDVLSPEAVLEHPEIKTYDILSVDNKIKGRITSSPMGMNVFMLTPGGHQYIQPFSYKDVLDHAVYDAKDYAGQEMAKLLCGVEDGIPAINAPEKTTNTVLGDARLRTYRLAVAATGEYTSWSGSQANALTNITTTVANVSLIYELQLAIKFTLVTNNSILFTDSLADPYPTVSFPTSALLDSNTKTLNTIIGSGNYDVGFVLNYGWNGGLAYTPAVCSVNKGGGSGGLNFSVVSPVMYNLMAHEIAHMFSAKHTMSTGTNAGPCSANVNLPTAYEPGGGSSIMAYAGSVCTGLFYQSNTDGYFHFNSEQAVITYAASLSTCGTQTVLSNNAPVVNVPANAYTIPVSTPFVLSATGTDANGDALTYNFEQYDAAATYMTATPSSTATSGPVFRSYPPAAASSRTFPPLANVLANSGNTWEVLPSVTRTMNFRVLARDNASGGGAVAYESVSVTTNSGAGPFSITSQNTSTSLTANGSNTMTVTWNVANTASAPVNAANVNILFSTDNGQTFPYTLASATANDGTETLIVPNLPTSAGRIKIAAANNIFFDINDAPIAITSTCAAAGSTFTPSSALSAPVGNAALSQGLTPVYGSVVNISGTLTSSDPTANLAIGSGTATNCASYSNTFQYKTFSFQPSVSGSYTFTRTTGSGLIVFDLYQTAYTPSSPCTNYLISNYVGGSGSSSYTVSLTVGITYVMAVGTFNSGSPALPASFVIGVTPPSGGNIYSGTPDPGAGYTYTFVIVDGAGNIKGYSATGDMSNAGNYPAGSYTVYGLSYSTAVTQATLNTYIGGAFSALQTDLLNSVICGNLSSNSRAVTVTVPLALGQFSLAAVRKNNTAVLTLATGEEKDMDHYLVTRSTNGKDFEPIGNIAAKGQGSNHVYYFTDDQPAAGINYYRMLAVTHAAEQYYSNIALVNFGQYINASASVFPNPLTEGQATVRLNYTPGLVHCRITDISGRLLRSFTCTDQQFGIDLRDYAPGIYFLNIAVNGERINLRLVRP